VDWSKEWKTAWRFVMNAGLKRLRWEVGLFVEKVCHALAAGHFDVLQKVNTSRCVVEKFAWFITCNMVGIAIFSRPRDECRFEYVIFPDHEMSTENPARALLGILGRCKRDSREYAALTNMASDARAAKR
jgi:hypothetical protein